MMMKRAGLLTLSFLLMPALNSAQSNCPQGFVYAGTLSGAGSFVEAFDNTKVLRLPANATLDESFQQTKARATSANGKSNLSPKDIPKGILIIPHGSNDREKMWSVSEPRLIEIKAEDDSGVSSTRYEFGMRLSCSVKDNPYAQQGGDCDVEVEVCYKRKSNN
jgi:hypothetical protein